MRMSGISSAAAAILLAAPAMGQSTESATPAVIADLARCRAVADAAARLGCFDAAAARLDNDLAERRITVLDKEGVRRTRRSLFGFNLPKVGLFGKAEPKEDFVEIDSVVDQVRALRDQRYELVLSDGARWQTTEPSRWVPRSGAKVRIRKAALGSFWIAVERMPTIRGQRVG